MLSIDLKDFNGLRGKICSALRLGLCSSVENTCIDDAVLALLTVAVCFVEMFMMFLPTRPLDCASISSSGLISTRLPLPLGESSRQCQNLLFIISDSFSPSLSLANQILTSVSNLQSKSNRCPSAIAAIPPSTLSNPSAPAVVFSSCRSQPRERRLD
ncbi:hypothetical protein NL676_016044 [Syzygium grande]|nr:hypothetical protein NL676_016044 [Syzygium grande]